MAASTFGDVWRRVRLYAPTAPAMLARDWVQSAYNDICGRRHWAWLRETTTLSVLAQRAVTVTVVQGSRAITSSAEFEASDAGRQIRRATGQPFYTIDTVTDASTATLTQAYAGVSVTMAMTIGDVYLAMPEDFRSFETVTDPSLQRPIAWWIQRGRLDLFDPGRIASDVRFRVLVAAQISPATGLSGRLLYEMWPRPTSAGQYVMSYFKRSDRIEEDTPFQGVLATRSDVLMQGALAQCARWPGTKAEPNPYFSLALAREHQGSFNEFVQQLDVLDDDQYTMLQDQTDLSKYGLAALSADTTLMRQSDATIADYF